MSAGRDARGKEPADAFERALQKKDGWGLTRLDVAVAALVLVAAALLAWWVWGGRGFSAVPGDDAVSGGLVVVVQNTEGFYEVLPLSSNARIAVEGNRGTNVIEVADNRVRCVESDCSNQVCVQTGWVGSAGEMLVCLPHELTVQVVADEADASPLV